MRKQIRKRWMACFLMLVMAASLLPGTAASLLPGTGLTALAAEDDENLSGGVVYSTGNDADDTHPQGRMRAPAAPAAAGELQVTGAYVGHTAADAKWVASYNPSASITAIDPGIFYVGEKVYIKLVANSTPVKWTVKIGVLSDTGLTLDENTGVISGTLAKSTNGYLTLAATNTQTGAYLSFWLFMDYYSEDQKPVITTNSLPDGNVGREYSQWLEYTGYSSGWENWQVVSGNLPNGLQMSGANIGGTPTKAGTYTFTLKLTTAAGTTQKKFTLKIGNALIAPVFTDHSSAYSLPYAVINKNYSYDINLLLANRDTCSRPLSWKNNHSLPTGLALDTSTGVLSGTPSDPGQAELHTFSVSVQNTAGITSKYFELRLYQQPVITSTETHLDAVTGVYFQWKPSCTGRDISSEWSAVGLPAGLKFSDGNGTIYGTPTVPGSYDVRLKLTTNSELYAEKDLTLVVAENNSIDISQTSKHTFYGQKEGYAESDLTAKEVTVENTGYSDLLLTYTLTGANSDSFELSKFSETLPKGETTSFTVKPKTGLPEGTYTAVVQVRSGSLVSAFEVEFTVSKNIVRPTVITEDSFPYAVVGKPWSYQLQASGTGPFTWAKARETTNPWPAWLNLDPDTGMISGTPTESELQVTLYAEVTNEKKDSDEGYFYFKVYDKPTITLKAKDSSGNFAPYPSDILPDVYTDSWGDYVRFDTGEGGGYISTSVEGAMPSGMRFVDNDSWGALIPDSPSTGTYSFTLVSRSYADSEKTQFIGEDRKTVTMAVYNRPHFEAPGFYTGEMWAGTAITPIDFSKMFSGGKAPLTYTAEAGTYPQGLTLDPNTGILSGTPLIAGGGDAFRIFCTDANGKVADPVIYYGRCYLPEVTFGTPHGSSFLVGEGLDLKLDYPVLDGNVKLYYTTDGTDPQTSSTKIEANPGETVKIGTTAGAGDRVWVQVIAYQSTAGNNSKWSNTYGAVYYSVDRPVPPTANWENGTTFTTVLGVMLSCDTAGATILYKLGDSGSFETYTGTPILVTETTTLTVSSLLKGHSSETATYTYTKVDGVELTGAVKSYNPKNAVTLQLMKQGQSGAAYETTIAAGTSSDGNPLAQSFRFESVAAGTYDLVVRKDAHLVYTVKNIEVGASAIDLTKHANAGIRTITLIAGNMNGDSNVNADDLNVVWNAANFNRSTKDAANKLTDINGDGNVNADDLNIIWNALNFNKSVSSCVVNF